MSIAALLAVPAAIVLIVGAIYLVLTKGIEFFFDAVKSLF